MTRSHTTRTRRGKRTVVAARAQAATDPVDELALTVLPRQNMRRKLGRIVLVTILAQGVVAAVALTTLQGPWREAKRLDHGATLASLAVDQLRGQRLASYNIFAEAILERIANAPSVQFATLLDSQSQVVLQSGSEERARRLLQSAIDGRAVGETGLALAAPVDGVVVYESPLTDISGAPFRLVLGMKDLSAQRALLDGAAALFVGMIGAGLVALPIGLWRFQRWTSSLHSLHRGIRRLAMDAPLQPVTVSGEDEIAYLSIAFNEMASKLTASRNELVEANRVLEQRVAERTEDLRIANAKLERQNITLEELTETALRFTDDVAHEFRTPLAVISEFASILFDGLGGELTAKQEEYMRFISSASSDLERLVDDFLDTGKLRAGVLRVDRRATRVEDVLDRIWPMLEMRAATTQVRVERRIQPGTPRAYVDREKLGRAVLNLAVNAIKFSPPGARVVIEAARTETGAVSLSVIDEGPGIAPDEVSALFERFEQTRTGRDADAKGFGLGLNITRELVRLNLGQVEISSEIGKGSVFTITVPSDDAAVIVDSYVRSLRASHTARLGLMWIDAAQAENADADVAGRIATFAHPDDLYLPRPSGGVLAAGPTESVGGWRDRLLCEDAKRSHASGGACPRLQILATDTCTLTEARERILDGLARAPETQRRAA